MKILSLLVLGFASISFADTAPRKIEMETKKVGEAIHWSPDVVEVTQGEKVQFLVKHNVEGGFNFHGFQIAPLNIRKQVDRGKDLVVDATVPATLKAGDYEIGCQFHPKHVPAKLVVKPKTAATSEKDAKTAPAPAAK